MGAFDLPSVVVILRVVSLAERVVVVVVFVIVVVVDVVVSLIARFAKQSVFANGNFLTDQIPMIRRYKSHH